MGPKNNTQAPRPRRVITINDYTVPPRRTRSHTDPEDPELIDLDHPEAAREAIEADNAASLDAAIAATAAAEQEKSTGNPSTSRQTRATRSSTATLVAANIPRLPHPTLTSNPTQSPTKQSHPSNSTSSPKKAAPSKKAAAPNKSSPPKITPPQSKAPTNPPTMAANSDNAPQPNKFSDESILARQQEFMKKEKQWARAGDNESYLLSLPRKNLKYVGKDGKLLVNDDRFEVPISAAHQDGHPKAIDAEERGVLTRQIMIWYRGVDHGINRPVAGIPSSEPYRPHDLEAFEDRIGRVINDDANAQPQEDIFHARPSIKLIVPDILKAMLVDDWENVTKNYQLVPLPHPHPVSKIIDDYSAYETPKRPAGSSHVDILDETLSGLKEYFNRSLGRILLYR